MRPPQQPRLPVMPDAADVLEAIRRLELTGPHESHDLGPSAEAGVSGRSVSVGGPLVSVSVRDLGLLLDDELVDNLLLADGPNVSIPVEMALDALGAPNGWDSVSHEDHASAHAVDRAAADDLAYENAHAAAAHVRDEHRERHAPSAGDTLGVRWRLKSWSVNATGGALHELSDTLVPPPPAFLTDWPIRPRARRAPSRFRWDLLQGGDRLASNRDSRAGARWTTPVADVAEPSGRVEDTAWAQANGPDRVRAAERVLAEARRSPSAGTVALASFVFPGWGQALNEEPGKGAAFRFAYLATLSFAAALAWRGPIGGMAAALTAIDPAPVFGWLDVAFTTGAALWLLSVYDALVVRVARLR